MMMTNDDDGGDDNIDDNDDDDAEELLVKDGDFLVRESQGSPGQYVLTGMQVCLFVFVFVYLFFWWLICNWLWRREVEGNTSCWSIHRGWWGQGTGVLTVWLTSLTSTGGNVGFDDGNDGNGGDDFCDDYADDNDGDDNPLNLQEQQASDHLRWVCSEIGHPCDKTMEVTKHVYKKPSSQSSPCIYPAPLMSVVLYAA